MYEATVTYKNADNQFRFDEEIRAMMAWRCGEENDSRHNLATHMREITFVLKDENDAILAAGALEETLGDSFKEITWTGRPVEITLDESKEPKTTDPVIDLDPSMTPGECPSVLPFKPCAESKHSDSIVPRTAEEVFYDYSERLEWDEAMQTEVLVEWLIEEAIGPLLGYIQEAEQTENFADYLFMNFDENAPQEAWHPCV